MPIHHDHLLAELLSANRINWRLVRDLGYDLEAIAREARTHGDEVLARKALRAARR